MVRGIALYSRKFCNSLCAVVVDASGAMSVMRSVLKVDVDTHSIAGWNESNIFSMTGSVESKVSMTSP